MNATGAVAIKVLLVDDHPVVRTGYRHLLQSAPGIAVVAEADDSASAYEAFKALEPDVVVMDISLPGPSGIEAMKRMRAHRPQSRVLIFSMHDEAIFVSRALRSGAAGFLSKASAPERLIEAVRAVARGESYTSGEAGEGAAGAAAAAGSRLNDLSHREAEVLRLWAQGLGLDEIGVRLGVSGKTVANYQSLVRQKLGVHNDVQLMRLAAEIWSGRS
jgi:two-component system, NarL family, invasion response regulator UvrY